MPDAHLGEEEGLVVVARVRQRVHAMPPEPGKQRNQAAHLERVDERRRLALPVRHAADAHLGQQQREDGKHLDRLQDGGAVGLHGGAGGLLQEVDEDDAGGQDEDDCALAEGILGLEDGAGEAGELDGDHLDVDADADAQAVEVGVALDGAVCDGGVHGYDAVVLAWRRGRNKVSSFNVLSKLLDLLVL